MNTPQWWDDLFVDADLLTAASAQVATNFQTLPQVGYTPGWFNGTDTGNINFSQTGFNVTTTFASFSFALFNTGVLAGAYGTTDGATPTFQYETNFNSLVPGSGSVTAYLVATPLTIQQQPTQVTGPPPFHPDYDPTFEPYEAFLEKQDSLQLIATLTAPDNLTSLELCRVVLTAGNTTFDSLDSSHQIRAGAVLSRNGEVLSADIQDSIVLPGSPSTPGNFTVGGNIVSTDGSLSSSASGGVEAGTGGVATTGNLQVDGSGLIEGGAQILGNVTLGTTEEHPIANVNDGWNVGATGQVSSYSASGAPLQLGTGTVGTVLGFSYTSGFVGSISTDGAMVIYNTTSDYRVKTILGKVEDAGLLVDSVPVHQGEFTARPGVRRAMFLAHEVQDAIPSAVTGVKDAVCPADIMASDGETVLQKAGTPVLQQLDQQALIPILWAANQELRARVLALEAKLGL